MSAARIREDLDELGEAAAMLVEGRLSYEDALAGYFPRLVDAYVGDRSHGRDVRGRPPRRSSEVYGFGRERS